MNDEIFYAEIRRRKLFPDGTEGRDAKSFVVGPRRHSYSVPTPMQTTEPDANGFYLQDGVLRHVSIPRPAALDAGRDPVQ